MPSDSAILPSIVTSGESRLTIRLLFLISSTVTMQSLSSVRVEQAEDRLARRAGRAAAAGGVVSIGAVARDDRHELRLDRRDDLVVDVLLGDRAGEDHAADARPMR